MKQTYSYFSLAFSLLLVGQAQAQLVAFSDADGNTVANGSMVMVNGAFADTNLVLGVGLEVENVSGSTHIINVKRYELNVPALTRNYFCWDVCYGEVMAGARPSWFASDPINMTAGQTANGFHAYYRPMEVEGDAMFRYVWYNFSNPNDSNWVDIHFSAMSVGIAENASTVNAFKVFPNPSTGGDITLNYDLAAAATGTQLAVYNVLGERKLVRNLGAVQGKVTLRDGELASGVWFAVLERNGKALATKRVVVAR